MKRLKVIRMYKSCNRTGGVHNRLAELLPRLAEHADVRLLCYRKRGDRAEELEASGVPVDVLPLGSKWAPWNTARYIRYFGEHRPDVVHTHEYTANTLGVAAARRAGVPVCVRHLHTAAPWGDGGAWRIRRRMREDIRAAADAQLTLAVSEAVRAHYLKSTGLASESCRVLYNGIDLGRFAGCRAAGRGVREELGIDPRAVVVGMVGRLTSGKGHEDFLQAAARVLRCCDRTCFIVVGGGGEREVLQTSARRLGLGDHVVFTGHREDVPAVLGALDLLVFPSRSEGLPGVVIEAQAAGVPVVATRLEVMSEVVKDGVTGILVPLGSLDALAQAMEHYMTDPQGRAAAGRAAALSAQKFSLDRCVAETLALYRELARPL